MTDAYIHPIGQRDREKALDQHAHVFWLTGLSGSGKTTLAEGLERKLAGSGISAMLLDGDLLRKGLNSDLGFSKADRSENIRRAGHVSRILYEAGLVVIASFISPIAEDRQRVRSLFIQGSFSEIHIKADLEVCEARDPKGLYAKARAGAVKEFTGIDSPYEVPLHPELIIETNRATVEESLKRLLDFAVLRLKY